MKMVPRALVGAALAVAWVGSVTAEAQVFYPQAQQPAYYPTPQPVFQPQYPAAQPPYQGGGGGYPGGLAPFVNPNGAASQSSSSSAFWDPNRGWVTNAQDTTVLNSANSPWRNTVMPGTSVQTFNHWDGTKWVQGSRWLGQDGLWHGDETTTAVGPNGSTSSSTVYRSAPQPNRGQAPQATGVPTAGAAPGAPSSFGLQFRRP